MIDIVYGNVSKYLFRKGLFVYVLTQNDTNITNIVTSESKISKIKEVLLTEFSNSLKSSLCSK